MPFAPARFGATPFYFDKKLDEEEEPEDLVALPAGMVGIAVSLHVRKHDARIAFDAEADEDSLLVRKDEGYSQEHITIRERISFVGDDDKKPNVSGVVWAR